MAAAGLQTYADAGYGDIVNESTVWVYYNIINNEISSMSILHE